MQFFGKTDIGAVRDSNQDNFFVGYLDIEGVHEPVFLAVVCDGMGGVAGGSLASSLATDTFVRQISTGIKNVIAEDLPNDTCESILSFAIRCANDEIFSAAKENPEFSGMGTTLVAMLIFRETVYIANVGDSRLYCVADEGICRLTRDHSYVQTLLDQGKITEKEANEHPNKNIIMRAVGTDRDITPDFFKILPDRKSFLLCSDGLSNYVSEEQLLQFVKNGETAEDIVNKMIDTAISAGGGDNITAVFVKY
jgi:protein phosphatase